VPNGNDFETVKERIENQHQAQFNVISKDMIMYNIQQHWGRFDELLFGDEEEEQQAYA
jgi:hypothetical protein